MKKLILKKKNKFLFITITLLFVVFALFVNRFKLCKTEKLGNILSFNDKEVKEISYMLFPESKESTQNYIINSLTDSEEINKFMSALKSLKVTKVKYFIPSNDKAMHFSVSLKDKNGHDIYVIWENDSCLYVSLKGIEENGDTYVIPELYYKKSERNFIENYFCKTGDGSMSCK